ncbi:MAG: ATP-binding cassette domain-containing protein [Spirochaetaceae bacterium]
MKPVDELEPVVELENVTVSFGLHRAVSEASLAIRPGEVWAILGPNGSGKTVLSEVVAGRREPTHGRVIFAEGLQPATDIRVVSFEEQLRVMADERRHDESWIMHGRIDEGTPVEEFVKAGARTSRAAEGNAGFEGRRRVDRDVETLLRQFRIAHLRKRGLRFLSTGEMRKSLLCRALAGGPRVIVLDDPFDGLDVEAQEHLRRDIDELADGETTLLVVAGRRGDLPDSTTHVAFLEGGRLRFAGPRRELSLASAPGPADRYEVRLDARVSGGLHLPAPPRHEPFPPDRPVIEMRGVSVSYGEKRILAPLDWEARLGEVWHILGPNGAGKSTLLSLVDGSNPKAYGQHIRLFGQLRGSGESVWDIKRRIGFVSADFHNSYPSRTTARDAVLSGFRDSAGLYEQPTGYQIQIAERWLDILGFRDRGGDKLRTFSYGEQRAILVARAMVKMPPLLVADEPSQGLDDHHSAFVLSILERVGRETDTCVLYVSHKPEFTLDCATHRMQILPQDDSKGSQVVIEEL